MTENEVSPLPSKKENILTVELLLEKIGGYSWFQLLATLIIISPEIPASMIAISPVLTGSSDFVYHCQTATNNYSNLSKNQICQYNNCTGCNYFVCFISECQAMAGAILCAGLADRFGRKPMFFSLCFLMGTFGFAAGLANHIAVYALSRAFAGFAVGGMYVVYLNYLMEFLTPNFRTICGCVSFWGIGEMLLGLFGYLLPGWRQLSWATSAPVFLTLLAFPLLPESPRWLLCQGRTDDALIMFNKIAAFNGKPKLDLSDLKALTLTKESEANKPTLATSLEMFKAPPIRNQMFIFMWAWFSSALVYYGLSFNTKNLSGDPNWNVFYLGLSDLPGSLSAMMFNNRFGRKRTYLGFSFLSAFLLTFLCVAREIYLVEMYPALGLVLPLLGRYSTSANWAVLACFTAESFPTFNRASSIGICSFCSSLGGILAPQLAFIGTIWSFGPYLVFCVITITSSLAALALRETSGKPLQDLNV